MKRLFAVLATLHAIMPSNAQEVRGWQHELMYEINVEDRIKWLDRPMKVTSNTTNLVGMGIPLTMLVVAYADGDSKLRQAGWQATESLALTGVLTWGLKYTFREKRPFQKWPDIVKLGSGGSYSFPSGHSSMAFSTATSVAMSYPKWYVAAPAYTWAATVAYSRMHLGVHTLSDVVAGAIVGSGSAIVTHKADKWLRNKKSRRLMTSG